MHRIMSYNIHHGEDLKGNNTLKEIGHLISDLGIDFCLLQEIDYSNDRSAGIDQLQLLSQYSDLEYAIPAKIISYRNGYYGTGVLSAFPSHSSKVIPLPVLAKGESEDTIGKLHKAEPRAIHCSTFGLPEGDLTLLNTHFSMWQSERAEGFAQLATYFNSQAPTILGGDFNTLHSQEYSSLSQYQLELLPTFINPKPTQPIDRFFAKNVQVEKIFSLPVEYSDHLPLVMEFSLV